MEREGRQQPINPVDFLGLLESRLRKSASGITLLGEIVFTEADCEAVATNFRAIVDEDGPAPAFRTIRKRWPLCLATWLTNEAFYSFKSGAYWPPVLESVGIDDVNNYSSQIGRHFIDILETRGLPRFRQLKTRWHYLGPILGHCGIPRSCLSEFFEKVVPRAHDLGVGYGAGFEDLVQHLKQLYLTKPTERFIRFGGKLAEDFVRRAVELDTFQRKRGGIPTAGSTGLPERVVGAYEEFLDEVRDAPEKRVDYTPRRRFRKPVLLFDEWHGMRLQLPGQALVAGELELTWQVQVGSDAALTCAAAKLPGEDTSCELEEFLASPFSTLTVNLDSNNARLASWTFEGISKAEPVIFFDHETLQVFPRRRVEPGPVGIIWPQANQVLCRRGEKDTPAAVIGNLGALPLRWEELGAAIVDLTDSEALLLTNGDGETIYSVELEDNFLPAPQLAPEPDARIDGDTGVFIGAPPSIRIWRQARQAPGEFLGSWRIQIVPLLSSNEVPEQSVMLADIIEESDLGEGGEWVSFSTSEQSLLGAIPYGRFMVQVEGPLGQHAAFRFAVVPPFAIDVDPEGLSVDQQEMFCRLRLAEGVEILDADERYNPDTQCIRVSSGRHLLQAGVDGYGGYRWRLPIPIATPRPLWALYRRDSEQHVLTWTGAAFSTSLNELQEHPLMLLVQTATPWGVPAGSSIELRARGKVIRRAQLELDSKGRARADLTGLIADAAAERGNRYDLVLVLDFLARNSIEISCGVLTRRWEPADFQCEVAADQTDFRWTDTLRAENRAVRIEPLLTPWIPGVDHPIPDEAEGRWSIDTTTLFPAPGPYAITLGQLDPWTDVFECSTVSLTTERGDIDQWQNGTLFNDNTFDGYLYRRLMAAYSGTPDEHSDDALPIHDNPTECAERLINSSERLRRFTELNSLRTLVDRLLRTLSPVDVLTAIAHGSGAAEVSALTRASIFMHPWRRRQEEVSDDEEPTPPPLLSDADSETLWRIWPPFGIHADLYAFRHGNAAARQRIVERLGAADIKRLSRVRPRAQWRHKTPLLPQKAVPQVLRVISDERHDPFDVERLAEGVRIILKLSSPGAKAREFTLLRSGDGELTLEGLGDLAARSDLDSDDATLPELRRFSWQQPKGHVFVGVPPDPQVMACVRAEQGAALKQIRAHWEALPNAIVGVEAYQDACFEWSIRLAGDAEFRDTLSKVCGEIAERIYSDLRTQCSSKPFLLEYPLIHELMGRWTHHITSDPLFAIPMLSLATAIRCVWTGRGRVRPFELREDELATLVVAMDTVAPELFSHDLTLTCLCEALRFARKMKDGA